MTNQSQPPCGRRRLLPHETFVLKKRVKFKKCVSVLQNDGVKKLVGSMHNFGAPNLLFSSTHYK